MKTVTLNKLTAARKALDAKINRLENNIPIKVGDFVYLKKNSIDAYGYWAFEAYYAYAPFNNEWRIEYKVVEVKGNNVTVIPIQEYDPKGHETAVYNRKNVYPCKKPQEEAAWMYFYLKDLIWKEWEKATGKRRPWDWDIECKATW
jgi:hypothetical protein